MALSREQMLDRMMASDPGYNGRFIVGVLSTGVYCLPGCRARRPKPENVRFYQNGAEARAAGLRPCKICKPDEFESGHDSALERLEGAASEAIEHPGKFPTVEDLADAVCVSVSTLHQQFREHYQIAPGAFLTRARIDAACRLLRSSKEDAGAVGARVGFESASGFYESFRKLTGMTPAAYAGLSGTREFELLLPESYPTAELLKVLARDPDSVSEKLCDNTYCVAYESGGRPERLEMTISPGQAVCALEGEDGFLAHETATRILNLRQDAAGFERLATDLGYERLFAGRAGMRVPQTVNAFEGLIWVVLGQQVNFRFAAILRARVTVRVGQKVGDLYCVPEPSKVADMDRCELLRMQLSRQKTDYLLGIAEAAASGSLELQALGRRSATFAERTLLEVRGLGVWSVNYLMMRSLGFNDCVPLGDTGISTGLKNFLELDDRPKGPECGELMAPFAPYRSLASYHLWRGWSG